MLKRFLAFAFLCLIGAQGFAQMEGLPKYIIDVNPLMWIFSGIFDENNNRSVYFDGDFQYTLNENTAVKVNPAFAVGLAKIDGENEGEAAPSFFDLEVPIGIMTFPFIEHVPVFFALSLTPGVYLNFDNDKEPGYFLIGALIECGYQFRLKNHLVLTASAGVSRMFPIPLEEGKSNTAPHYNLHSPWTEDSPVSPRFRLAVGFWQ